MRHKLLLFILLSPILSMCQPIEIRGKIINEQNEPIPAASITLKRTGHTTLSDENGLFTIHDSRLSDTLIITAAGYEIQETPNNERGLITIILRRKITSLQEVVVNTGYQKMPVERTTGSFTTISNDMLNCQVGPDILSRLEGITNAVVFDKHPSRPPITIRGISTILSDKQPLIVLDDFPYEGSINDINPNDVENITILKDAAAASVWGTRAGNGVIVITTKKGKINQPLRLSLNVNFTTQAKPDLSYINQIGASSFIDMEQFLFSKGYYNNMETANTKPYLSPVVEWLIAKRDGLITPAEADREINALRSLDLRPHLLSNIYQPSSNQQYAITASGGSNNHAWNLSGGYDNNLSTLSDQYSRYTFKADNQFRLRRFQISTGIIYANGQSLSGKSPWQVNKMGPVKVYPYSQLIDITGDPQPFYAYRKSYIDTAGGGKLLDWKYYPLDEHNHSEIKTNTRSVLARIGLQYKILASLNLDLNYQYQEQLLQETNRQGLNSYAARSQVNMFSQINRTTGVITYKLPMGDILDLSSSVLKAHNLRSQLNWNQNFGRHHVMAIAGGELRNIISSGNSHNVYGYNDDVLSTGRVDYNMAHPTFITGSSLFISDGISFFENLNRYISYYGNAAYTYNDRYTFSASARKDASNLFGVNANEKGLPLWSAGAAWKLSSESFYHLNALPYLRLRLTYGFSGNVALDRSAVTTMNYFGAAQYTGFLSGRIAQYPNPELRWEKVRTVNAGLDFEFNNNKLSGSLEYYRKSGLDLFGAAPIDYTTGVGTSIMRNVASIKGSGMDLQLNLDNIGKRFTWSSVIIANYNNSEVTDYYQLSLQANRYVNDGGSITALPGYPVYSIISFPWAGLDNQGNPLGYFNGQLSSNYQDILGQDNKVGDISFNGPAIPKFTAGLFNSFAFKGITLSANITGKFGHYFRRKSVNYSLLFADGIGHTDFDLRWKQPGDENFTSVPSMIYPVSSLRESFYQSSDILAEKAAHIRLQFINLSYTVTKKTWRRLPLSEIQVYGNASNMGILWAANDHDIDPDYGYNMPPSKQFAFGIKTIF